METRQVEIALTPDMRLPIFVAADVASLVTDPEDPDQVPCWAEIWPAAQGLAALLWQGPALSGISVLELGAGAGLPGVICGIKGAAVVFSDFQPRALELCADNAVLHGLRNFRLLLEDWRSFRCRQRFDLVLGADIAYEPRLLPHLREVLLRVCKPAGKVMLAHPGRPVTLSFVQELTAAGPFREERVSLPVTTDDPVIRHHTIIVHLLFRIQE